MKERSAQFVFVIIMFGLPLAALAQDIEGSWMLERYQFEGPSIKREVNPAQASLFLFTETHYSFSYVLGEAPRAALPEKPSGEEIAAAYHSFVSNSGRYVKGSDSTLTTYPIISRNPNVTAENTPPVHYVYSIQRDTLWLTLPEAPGDVKVRVDYVLRRIEGE